MRVSITHVCHSSKMLLPSRQTSLSAASGGRRGDVVSNELLVAEERREEGTSAWEYGFKHRAQ